MEGRPSTLAEVAAFLEGELRGPGDLPVRGLQALDRAGPAEISFAVGPHLAEAVGRSGAGAIILPRDWPHPVDRPAVLVADPYLAYALLATVFSRTPFRVGGVSQRATVGEDCEIAPEVSIHPGVYLGDRVRVAAGVTLFPGVYLGDDVFVGEETVLHPNVVVYHGCRLGARVIVHAGVVIGSDGFGYAQRRGSHVKIPQTGIVVVEDDVEIGANVTVDRAALGETRIGRGTKIDNLVQVGHNVSIGPDSIVVAQAGLAGSSRLGAGVMLGGQVGVAGHITLGDRVKVAAQAGVTHDVGAGEVVSGSPAMPHKTFLRVAGALKRLPELLRDVRDLNERVRRLEESGRS